MDVMNKIIGYDGIKSELRSLADIMKNYEKYEKLGVKFPHGIMLYGDPGVGKSLMASCLIEASGWNCYICRKDKPNGQFVNYIRETFSKAIANEPSIVLLEDLDKFSADNRCNNNSDEYVTVQSCIDSAKDKKIVVIATVNEQYLLPESLRRDGRFDEKYKIDRPRGEDSKNIIKYYLSQKKHVSDLNIDEIANLLSGFSCAELENLINRAGIIAGYAGKSQIEMDDIIMAYIKNCFKSPACSAVRSKKELESVAYHEAGHAVMGELLQPNSVLLISISYHTGSIGGFTTYGDSDNLHVDKELMENRIITLLAGKAAMEIKFGKLDIGAASDIERAHNIVKRIICELCEFGFDNYVSRDGRKATTDNIESKITQELNRYYLKCKELLTQNMHLVDRVAQELMKKEIITRSEIVRIMNNN